MFLNNPEGQSTFGATAIIMYIEIEINDDKKETQSLLFKQRVEYVSNCTDVIEKIKLSKYSVSHLYSFRSFCFLVNMSHFTRYILHNKKKLRIASRCILHLAGRVGRGNLALKHSDP